MAIQSDAEPQRVERPCPPVNLKGGGGGDMLLWCIIEDVAEAAIPRSRVVNGKGSCEAADLRQDFFVYLLERASSFAVGFRGTSEPELRRYLWVAAVRFARKRSGRARRSHARELEAIVRRVMTATGPSEAEIAFSASELDALLTEPERARLVAFRAAAIVGDSSCSDVAAPDAGPSSRTVRRWGEAIFRKYSDRF